MKTLSKLLAISVFALASISTAFAQQPAVASAIAGNDMTDGEIRKIDKDSKKITIKHGDIKNLDMPAMTMVFQVKDAAMLDTIQVGDKVSFKVIKTDSGYVVTELRAPK